MADKSRIFIFTTAYLPLLGGSEIAIAEMTRRLPEFQFEIITARLDPTHPPFEERYNVRIHRVGSGLATASFLLPKNFFPISAFLKARRLARQGQPMAIHAFQASQAAGGAWLFKLFNPRVPYLLTIQEGKNLASQGWLTNFFRGLLIRSADEITVISNYLADYVRSVAPSAQVRRIPNAVDTELFHRVEDSALRRELDLESKKVVVTASRLVEKNGVGDLIDAFKILTQEDSNLKLLIIGAGPLRSVLEEKARGIPGVKFIGQVAYESLPRYLSLADIFARPSLSEGLGNAFLEAMACQVPVVGTPVGGIPDFIKEGETGLFCEPGNPADIAQSIKKLLSDQNLADKLKANGHALVSREYQWSHIAEKYGQLYKIYA